MITALTMYLLAEKFSPQDLNWSGKEKLEKVAAILCVFSLVSAILTDFGLIRLIFKTSL